MTGIENLAELLSSLSPVLNEGDFVFCTVHGELRNYLPLNPLLTFQENEGLTLILSAETARKAGLDFEGIYRQITLTVHSSLAAVGLTAAVSEKLAAKGISANMVAAYYHDHIFVQKDKAEMAVQALKEF